MRNALRTNCWRIFVFPILINYYLYTYLSHLVHGWNMCCKLLFMISNLFQITWTYLFKSYHMMHSEIHTYKIGIEIFINSQKNVYNKYQFSICHIIFIYPGTTNFTEDFLKWQHGRYSFVVVQFACNLALPNV